MAAGEPHGLKPLGLDALDMLRIEAGLIFAGYEFDDQVDPFEAGIGFTVTADKEEDFVGRDSLLERREHPQRQLVGLELEGNETAGHGDCVHVGRSQVGVDHERHPLSVLKKNIALCRMAVQYAEPGTEVEVGKLDGHQKRIPATVVRFPFYDPEDPPALVIESFSRRSGRGVRSRRLPDPRGGSRRAGCPRPPPRGLEPLSRAATRRGSSPTR